MSGECGRRSEQLADRFGRHTEFMLTNDSTTIAVEIPVWLAQEDIAALETEHGFRLLSADAESSITGHIDFLQVRNGAVHILDYKPYARTNKPIAQLTIYALALSRLTGIKLFDIKCAWFNENEYCEFFPPHCFRAVGAAARHNRSSRNVATHLDRHPSARGTTAPLAYQQ